MVSTSCIPTPTPTPIPPTATYTPIPLTPTPKPDTILYDCKSTDKCWVWISTTTNDSGNPIIEVKSDRRFEYDERVEYYSPCITADGGDLVCEVYRDIDGNIFPRNRFVYRRFLRKIY